MSEEKEYQIGFWVNGLISPNEKLVFDDHLIIEGVPNKAQSKVFFKLKGRQVNDNLYENEKKKTLAEILQIYGLVSNVFVETPSGYCTSPITRENPFGKMKFIFCTIEGRPSEESKQRSKPLIEKAITKYYSIKDIFENRNKAFLRNAIDYYNRSLKDERLEEKLIDLMIALESLVSTGKDELALRYSLRMAFLVGIGQEKKRPEIFKVVKQLYEKRSNVVHGSSKVKLTFAEVHELEKIINQAIRRLIYINQSKNEFYELLDQVIYDKTKKQDLDAIVKEAIMQW